MGQSASDIIQITVSQQVASLLLPGFGIPLVLSAHNHFADRVRYYSANAAGLAQMVVDGFTTTEAAYLAASAIAAQSPAPTQFGIGKLLNKPTQQFDLAPTAHDNTLYQFTFDGHTVAFTSGVGATLNQIINGLKTAFDLFALPVTSSNNAGATLRLVANNPGDWHFLQSLDPNGNPSSTARANLSVAQTHADPGIAADMAAIMLFDNQWYAIINPWDSRAMAAALAAWVDSNKKFYIVNSVDDAILTSGTADIASDVKTASYSRTAVIYKSENQSFVQAAWMGRVLPLVAGSENWAYKTLAGVPADTLSENEISFAAGIPTASTQGKHASVYVTVFGVAVTEYGQVGSGSWLDITRGLDALIVDMGVRIFTDLSGPNKIPYTDKGIAIIEKDIRASLAFFQAPPQNFLSDSPAPTVTVPKAASLTPAQRAARLLPNVLFSANLAGALNSVTIQGTVIP